MGSDPLKDKHAQDFEQPQHVLYLSDYYIAKMPVTNAQYAAFVEATLREPPSPWESGKPLVGKEDHPVVDVTWHDAVAYCRWLAKITRRSYRLPSEAEWEKAARGTDGRIYPWRDEPPDESRCNFDKYIGETTPVGMYSQQGDGPYGCVDVAGNVWEWCAARDMKPYPNDVSEDEWSDEYLQGPESRVLRGGSWYDIQSFARCAYRYWSNPYDRDDLNGFRVYVAAQIGIDRVQRTLWEDARRPTSSTDLAEGGT
jgi:formylglycine-generating enzyme required for sulfatase activity